MAQGSPHNGSIAWITRLIIGQQSSGIVHVRHQVPAKQLQEKGVAQGQAHDDGHAFRPDFGVVPQQGFLQSVLRHFQGTARARAF